MINVADTNTGQMFDQWYFLGPKRRKMLERDWAGMFREHILPWLPLAKIIKKFSKSMGRPTKDIRMMLGLLILQQMHDTADIETIRQFAFNIEWRFALDVSDEGDLNGYVSERTVRNYRSKVIELKLDKILFEGLTDRLAEVFGVDVSQQRLDSTHVFSNMKKLNRLGLFRRTIIGFLKDVKRADKQAELPEDVLGRYLGKTSWDIDKIKPSESAKKLDVMARDLFWLCEHFKRQKDMRKLKSFKLLQRLLKEQCEVVEDIVAVKIPKELESDILQNPSDPDATYSGHKGQGFQAQIMDTYTPVEDGEKKDDATPDLITYVEVEPAHKHDSSAVIPALENTSKRDVAPDELLADTSYGSDENVENAREQDVELIAPTPGKLPAKKKINLKDFEFDSGGAVISCTCGHAPNEVSVSKNGVRTARFSAEFCADCPLKKKCPVKRASKGGGKLTYSEKDMRIMRRRTFEDTTEFKDKYRWRGGIEATNSTLKNKLGFGRLRVRGMGAVSFALTLKALALNILRCAKARAARLASDFAFLFVFLRLCSHFERPLRVHQPKIISNFELQHFSNSIKTLAQSA